MFSFSPVTQERLLSPVLIQDNNTPPLRHLLKMVPNVDAAAEIPSLFQPGIQIFYIK